MSVEKFVGLWETRWFNACLPARGVACRLTLQGLHEHVGGQKGDGAPMSRQARSEGRSLD